MSLQNKQQESENVQAIAPCATLTTRIIRLAVVPFVCCWQLSLAHELPKENGSYAAPDEALLQKKNSPWWYDFKPSPTPVKLLTRSATSEEQAVIDKANATITNKPAKAIALMDGDTVVYTGFKSPANADSYLFSFSMGKTITSMAAGQAICAGKLKLETKANELVPELKGKALGEASVRDLLRMASGAAEPEKDFSMLTTDQFKDWQRGTLNLLDMTVEDRVSRAAKNGSEDRKPGEYFYYKSTEPILVGIIVARATGMPYAKWLQESVINPMGAAQSGFYRQDKWQNGQSDAGISLRLEDWMRFALWVKRSSKEQSCFGDYVRAATSMQIANGTNVADRKTSKLFAGYGYFIWTNNVVIPNTVWASGWGGQRIGWNKSDSNDRMIITFSNLESWMLDVYDIARDWNKLNR